MPNIHLLKIAAPSVAKKARAGQFVVIRVDERGERIPLTIADWDREEGSITIVFMEVGTTTHKLAVLEAGNFITDFIGPLGLPTHIEKFGTVICVAGGFAVVLGQQVHLEIGDIRPTSHKIVAHQAIEIKRRDRARVHLVVHHFRLFGDQPGHFPGNLGG